MSVQGHHSVGGAVSKRGRIGAALVAFAVMLLGWSSSAGALPDGLGAERHVEGLNFPVAMAVAPGGDILVAEKGGAVRLVRNGELREAPVVRLEPVIEGEAGLLGIDVFDDYAETGRFAVTYTPVADQARVYISRARVTKYGGEVLDDPWKVLPSDPDIERNYGGRLRIAAGYLYVSLGDLGRHRAAQNRAQLAGSILRYNLDGTVADDNPFDSAVFAYGFRNSLGFDVVEDGSLWVADSGEYEHDEISRVIAGGNYGWPVVMGYCDNYPITEICDDGALLDPAYEFRWQIDASGVAVYDGDLMPALRGNVFVGGRHYGEIHRLLPASEGRRLELAEPFLVLPGSGPPAGIVDLAVAADGALLALVGDTPSGQILRISPEDAILDPEAILDEDTALRPGEGRACSVGAVGACTRWSTAALLFICLGLLVWALRRQRVARGVAVFASLLAVITLWSAKVSAQDFHYGVKAGGNLATVSGDNAVTAQLAPGWSAGIATRLQLHEHLAVSPELLYAWKGAANDTIDKRHLSHHLTLPVFLEGIGDVGFMRARICAGPAPTLVLSARTGDVFVTERLNRWGFAVVGGVGADVDIGTGMLTVDARFERGLTEVYDDRATPHYIHTPENYNNVAYLMVGYLF